MMNKTRNVRGIFARIYRYSFFILGCMILQACAAAGPGSFNLFSVSQDVTFGQQLKQEIDGNPQQYPVLDRNKYAKAKSSLCTMYPEFSILSRIVSRIW
ncbi:MAG: hypothetical protein AAFU64_11160 [Bacteroidota bacterium]